VRYFLLDRIDEWKAGEYAKGVKCVALSEDQFEHHFVGFPVLPGSLQIEAMAQLGGALLELTLRETLDYQPRCILSMVQQAKFREMAKPGDRIELTAQVLSLHEHDAQVKVEATVDGKRLSEATLIFVFARIDDERLEASRRDILELLTRDARRVDG
jgi:3-hydroxyacyl-[acyl-carrier-protein] dehydratase